MHMETNTGGGLKCLGRALSGDILFLNYLTAESDGAEIGFSACTPSGKVWLQTMLISKLAEAIIPFIPTKTK